MARVTHKRKAALLLVSAACLVCAGAEAQDGREASPAAAPVPAVSAPRDYPPALIEEGRRRFVANCGFCHGTDAAGGSGGSDLTRSTLVATDDGGDLIAAVVRTGRADAGMPAFPALDDSDLAAIVAFVHVRQVEAAASTGGRRSVDAVDLATGDATAGARYFDANCTECHSAAGDLADVGLRFEGLTLLRRMLYPGSESPRAAAARAVVVATTRDGRRFSGSLVHRDEFTVAMIDDAGRYRSWTADNVDMDFTNPLDGHVDQLGRYTDRDMHDVYAYLITLRQGEADASD